VGLDGLLLGGLAIVPTDSFLAKLANCSEHSLGIRGLRATMVTSICMRCTKLLATSTTGEGKIVMNVAGVKRATVPDYPVPVAIAEILSSCRA